jgi:hypothetical protein
MQARFVKNFTSEPDGIGNLRGWRSKGSALFEFSPGEARQNPDMLDPECVLAADWARDNPRGVPAGDL